MDELDKLILTHRVFGATVGFLVAAFLYGGVKLALFLAVILTFLDWGLTPWKLKGDDKKCS